MRVAGLQKVLQTLVLMNTTKPQRKININGDNTYVTNEFQTRDSNVWSLAQITIYFTGTSYSHRQALSDYGHIKVDFTFTCYVLPVSNRLPHNQNSRVVPYRCAFHCMVELVTRSIIEIKAGSTGIITNSSDSSVKKFPTS